MTGIRRVVICLAAALLWSGALWLGEAAAKEKHSPGRAAYVGPTPKENSHYRFDYNGNPLFNEDKKKKEKAKKAKKKKKSKKNKWRPRPGKRSPQKAAPPPEEDDGEDAMEPGDSEAKVSGEPPPREPETEASGKEKKDGEGFNYGGVKVGGGGPKFGGIPPTGQ